ncbi:hypothetical protein GU243_17685 [Pseudarthrobacter psychrotolerans]|uniref:Uncharacterized protein n=1 Tax=Pseudarthrobacter psychrotolerans TaxID=2697569 RepID=A0A6P1NR47_9MICC|nr:hypothetical protein [Pseudarthrobacter psychrotolerans]QHK21237.1 hypothetical protein GU243_17685 [Pseudarthrobacter psychrotolerans]
MSDLSGRTTAVIRASLGLGRGIRAEVILQDLASGRLALTDEAFQQLPNWRTAVYLRDILMQRGRNCSP